MRALMPPPLSLVELVVDVLHGVPIADPYRWLEDQNSSRTRAWIEDQTRYARAYLDHVPGRDRIRQRVRELLDVATYDSFLKTGTRYFFRKRLPGQEQPSIYFREGVDGGDHLLVDGRTRGTGDYTAVKPVRVSHDGSLLLYEVKQGGERMGRFEILDVPKRKRLPDSLPYGHLRGFAFATDGKSFYYVHEVAGGREPLYGAVLHHVLGTDSALDKQVFCAGEDETLRLAIISNAWTLGFLVYRFLDKTRTDFYLWRMGTAGQVIPVVRDADYSFSPRLLRGRILAITDQNAPNRRIVEVQPRRNQKPLFFDLVRETDVPIRDWLVTQNHVTTSYPRPAGSCVEIFDLYGKQVRKVCGSDAETVRLLCGGPENDEILLERESFVQPIAIDHYSLASGQSRPWFDRATPFDLNTYGHTEAAFQSKDGKSIPVLLAGKQDLIRGGTHPMIMTSYGGYGISVTPQFSVLVAFLMEGGCVFALPRIRGGAEFGAEWHNAARRSHRQIAFDDFLAAAEWLISKGRTTPSNLAIFGGSNAGLLVGAAITQRPELFCAALCLVPLLDMVRYHLFDDAVVWRSEFGTAEDPADFDALSGYSPYHHVRPDTAYPAVMLVSGDRDTRCNPMHARKMTARLQAANISCSPILLDYSDFRGHSPVLPLSIRVEALTDRLAFLSSALGVLSE
jgi:prolyl oligopeptidase